MSKPRPQPLSQPYDEAVSAVEDIVQELVDTPNVEAVCLLVVRDDGPVIMHANFITEVAGLRLASGAAEAVKMVAGILGRDPGPGVH